MRISVPIYRLKRQAKRLARSEKITHSEALDRVARNEGFGTWSLLAARMSNLGPATKLYGRLTAGDLVLVAARPGHGKTLMCLELALEAMKDGNRSFFFSLDYTESDVRGRFEALGADWLGYRDRFAFDGSDAFDAAHIIGKLTDAAPGTLVVVDYLQLLDQRRASPELTAQIQALRRFAQACGLIILFISQVDRSYDSSVKAFPDLRDIRLPNPLDLTLFDKACFLNNREVRFQAAA